jgi:putative phage-type endonuclease
MTEQREHTMMGTTPSATAYIHFVPLERVTPDAVFLGDPEPDTPEWVAMRRAGIGGTDVVAIVGESKHDNARTIWHDKRGDVLKLDDDADQSEAAEWGKELEPTVARVWARRRGAVLAHGGILGNVAEPWMRAQLDRMVIVCPDHDDQEQIMCALEVKTRNAFVAGKWRDDVPDDVLAQVAWQRLVTGLDHIHVACLIGGQRLVEHTYTRDVGLESYLSTAAAEMWQCVVDDVAPEVDWDALMSDLLDTLAPNRSGARDMGTDEAAKLIAAWRAKQAAQDVAGNAKAYAEGLIKNAMGSGEDAVEVLTYNGETVFTWREQGREPYSVGPATFRVLRGPRR